MLKQTQLVFLVCLALLKMMTTPKELILKVHHFHLFLLIVYKILEVLVHFENLKLNKKFSLHLNMWQLIQKRA